MCPGIRQDRRLIFVLGFWDGMYDIKLKHERGMGGNQDPGVK